LHNTLQFVATLQEDLQSSTESPSASVSKKGDESKTLSMPLSRPEPSQLSVLSVDAPGNRYFQLASDDGLGMGGGGAFAFSLDGDLSIGEFAILLVIPGLET